MKIPLAMFSLGFYLPLSGFLEDNQRSLELEKSDCSMKNELKDPNTIPNEGCSNESLCISRISD